MILEPTEAAAPASPEDSKAFFVTQLLNWYEDKKRDLPWRKTRDPYAIQVSEMMLQQTLVATVIPFWTRWMARFPTVQALAEAPLEDVLKHWQGLGYYARARNLHRAANVIVERHGGVFPVRFDDVLALPELAVTQLGRSVRSPLVRMCRLSMPMSSASSAGILACTVTRSRRKCRWRFGRSPKI